jgi:hypothetical protein
MPDGWDRQLAEFAESLVALPHLVEAVERDRLHRAPGAGEWSAHVIVCHLVLDEMNAATSLRLILTQDCPVIAEIEDVRCGSRPSTRTRQRPSGSGAPCARTTSASAPRRHPTTSSASAVFPGALRTSAFVTTWQAADATTASTSIRSGRRFLADASGHHAPRAPALRRARLPRARGGVDADRGRAGRGRREPGSPGYDQEQWAAGLHQPSANGGVFACTGDSFFQLFS